MAVLGLKISNIPEIRMVCPDFFWNKPQILPGFFQIAPDGFGKKRKIIHILQENEEDSTPALTSCSNSAAFADPWALIVQKTLRIPMEGSLKGLQPYNTRKTASPNLLRGISGKPRDI
jgi:hypothetical protein